MALQPPLGGMTAAARDRVEAALIEIMKFDTERTFVIMARERFFALTGERQRQYTDAELLRGIETARPTRSIAAE